ncbi:hypothetical protein [Oceanisphaera psychrotolerans]|uniref:hypothetical protein n=1 Tax=Oceanisphaera psychrotolerans TaxID=1414654 RepID=UPI001FE09718|nr:hypothetical protein [Oceanisphaera psychrotolerans]
MNWLMGPLFAQGMGAVGARYRGYRRQGSSVPAAGLCCAGLILAWLLFRLESPGWQALRAQARHWFPHLSPERPRLGDGLRYLLQSGWLLLTHPPGKRKPIWSGWSAFLRGSDRLHRVRPARRQSRRWRKNRRRMSFRHLPPADPAGFAGPAGC